MNPESKSLDTTWEFHQNQQQQSQQLMRHQLLQLVQAEPQELLVGALQDLKLLKRPTSRHHSSLLP
jgi:hypothetical protein